MRIKLGSEDIEAFTAVAHHLNFRTAAEGLNISASALSRRIQKLEHELDVKLLDRTTREVRLTLPGKQFLSRSQHILGEMEELATAMKGQTGARAALVKIGVIPSLAYQLLPGVLSEFHKLHPSARVLVRDLTTNEIVEAVARGDADFGVTSFVQPEASLAFRPLVRGEFVLALPPDHPLTGRKRIRWSELASHRIVSTWKGSGVRTVLDFELAKAASRLEAFYEVQQVFTALAFVEAGLGAAPVPNHFVSPGNRTRLELRPLIDPTVGIDIGVVLSRNHPLRAHSRTLYELLERRARELQRSLR